MEEKWDASIVATQDTMCLVLERKEFNRLLGGLKERILKTWSKERRRSLCAVDMEEFGAEQEEEGAAEQVVVQAEAKEHEPGSAFDLCSSTGTQSSKCSPHADIYRVSS